MAKVNETVTTSADLQTTSEMEESMSKQLKLDIFNQCKKEDVDDKASAGVLLRKLGEVGVLRDDPRLCQLMQTLQKFKRENYTNCYSISNIELDFIQFSKVLETNMTLIARFFQGKVIIPEFKTFCQDITDIYNKCKDHDIGKPATYIPQLARADPDKWGISLCTVDGQRFSIGDVNDHFSIQSCSKPFTYALCLDELGEEAVHDFIGREPSGRCFNEIAIDYNDQPHNPMVNSGAIMSSALLHYLIKPTLSTSEKFEFIESFFRRLAGGMEIGFQNSVFLSEQETADRNNALAFYMRERGCFPKMVDGSAVDIKKILDFYFQNCSLEVNCEVMSVMAGTLANGGICPITGERVLKSVSVKNVLSLMFSCGMYDYSGQFAFQVGLPAKSGVAGLVIIVVPNVVGFATWSPPLDSIGNSCRGVMFAKELVKIYNFHTFGTSNCPQKNPTTQNYEDKSVKLVQLLFAASNGDNMALERAYLSGVDMNMVDYDFRTALHLACAEDQKDCVKFLLEICNVDPMVKDRWGNTPLMEAQRLNRTQIVEIIEKYRKLDRWNKHKRNYSNVDNIEEYKEMQDAIKSNLAIRKKSLNTSIKEESTPPMKSRINNFADMVESIDSDAKNFLVRKLSSPVESQTSVQETFINQGENII